MLKQWGLGNFKSFYDETKLDLAPLTILTGTNSSGKSSFIQSMLLIAQTLYDPIKKRELTLNGPLVSLGVLRDNLSEPAKELNISFSFSIPDNEYKKRIIECSLYFDSKEKLQKMECFYHHIVRFLEEEEKGNITIKRTETGDIVVDDYDDGCFKPDLEIYGDPLKANGIKLSLDHFLPEFLFFAPDHPKNIEIDHKSNAEFLRDLRYLMPDNFEHIKDDLEKKLWVHLKTLVGTDNNKSPEELAEINRYVKLINEINLDQDNWISDLDDTKYFYRQAEEKIIDVVPSRGTPLVIDLLKHLFGKIDYVGPLRFREAIYPLSGYDKWSGSTGKYAASEIREHGEKKVSYLSPEYISNYSDSFMNREEITLKKALEKWLEYFEICKEIEAEQISNIGFRLKIKPLKRKSHETDEFLDLTQVGTGISQILPILIMGLLADKNSILIFEQPELHLHPRMQARLGDFFITMALLGKQCIIETHSKYFIDRIKFHYVEALSGNNEFFKDSTKIYYFDKDDLSAEVTSITIDEFGNYSEWPEGFFDETLYNNNDILNSISKRKRSSGNSIGPEIIDD